MLCWGKSVARIYKKCDAEVEKLKYKIAVILLCEKAFVFQSALNNEASPREKIYSGKK